MAELQLGNIKPAGADNVVVDGRYVKGGYMVIDTYANLQALKTTDDKTIIEGSLCYCQADGQFYQYNGATWIEKAFVESGDLGDLASKSTVELTDLASGIQTSLGLADSALQSFTETDPTVPDWAKAETKPSYNLGEISDTTDYVKITPTERTKLSGIAENANNYSLPQATDDALGGVKIGYAENNKNYPVELDTDGKMFVNVPWENTLPDHSSSNTTAGTFTKVTVNADGHVTAGENPTTLSGLGITDTYYTKDEADELFTTADTVKTIAVDEINAANLATVDKIKSVSTTGVNRSIVDCNDGIRWNDTLTAFDGEQFLGNQIVNSDIIKHVPIAAGDNIAFTIDEESQLVKINATDIVPSYSIDIDSEASVVSMITTLQEMRADISKFNVVVVNIINSSTYTLGLQIDHYSGTVYNIHGVDLTSGAAFKNTTDWSGVTMRVFTTYLKSPLEEPNDSLNNRTPIEAINELRDQLPMHYLSVSTSTLTKNSTLLDLVNFIEDAGLSSSERCWIHNYGNMPSCFKDILVSLGSPFANNLININEWRSPTNPLISLPGCVAEGTRTISEIIEDCEDRIKTSDKTILGAVNELSTKSPQVSITYADLYSLRDNVELIPGTFYRITDYQCTTAQENTIAANHSFDIIVQALSNNTLSEVASADHHEGDTYFANHNLAAWELKYCLDNDATRFKWADTENGKGVIYYLKDEFNNECPYDFKNIQFFDANGDYYYTFSYENYHDDDSEVKDLSLNTFYQYNEEIEDYDDTEIGCHGNIIKPYYNQTNGIDKGYGKVQYLNTIYFKNYMSELDGDGNTYCCYNNFFDFGCRNITFSKCCSLNKFGCDCRNIVLAKNCNYNEFNCDCRDISLEYGCKYNKFDTNNHDITLANTCLRNSFANGCDSIKLEYDCSDNKFEQSCRGINLASSCVRNIFGSACYTINFNSLCSMVRIGQGCNNIRLGRYCQNITVSDLCYHIYIGTNTSGYIKNIDIKGNCRYLSIEGTTSGSAAKYITDITVSAGIIGTASQHKQLTVSRNNSPIVYEANNTTHIILD